jgi:ABC-type multidrug transport system permease subunit
MLYCTIVFVVIGYCTRPYNVEHRTHRHYDVAKQMLNTISGALVGAVLGFSISVTSASLKRGKSGQLSLRTLFAGAFLFSMLCYCAVWYQYAASAQTSELSVLVRLIAE